MTRRRRIVATAVVLAVTAATGGGLVSRWEGTPTATWTKDAATVWRPPTDESPAPETGAWDAPASSLPDVDDAQRVVGAEVLLASRATALRKRDRAAWMETVDRPASAFGIRQARAFGNLLMLPVSGFGYRVREVAPALPTSRAAAAGPQAWVARVQGRYELTGFDRAARSFDATYTFVRRPGGWRIAADSDGATALQIWDLPQLRVVRSRSSLVIGNAPAARMRQYAAESDAGVRRVRSVWGSTWNGRVVLVTPATTTQFAGLIQHDDKGLDQVAAMTQGETEPGKSAQGDRVVVNPDAFDTLEPLGRRVVITHELTHIAIRSSTTRPVPVWLSEGMADYVGYLGLDLPRSRVAAELLTQVRKGKGPAALPTETDFDPARTQIAPSYSASWLACTLLADRYGQARLVTFYRAVADGTAGAKDTDPRTPESRRPEQLVQQGFPTAFGVTQREFVMGWRSYLSTLAKAS